MSVEFPPALPDLSKCRADCRANFSNADELLTELQTLIEAETNLADKNKEKALKQVKALAEAAQNPKAEEKQDLADTAITMLKGIITGFPSAATLIEACTKIAAFLGLA